MNDNIPIGMNGENIWYYNSDEEPPEEEKQETSKEIVGSGLYFTSNTYIGDIKLIEGERYYMSLDIETNWNGRMQICNEADNSCNNSSDRVYDIKIP